MDTLALLVSVLLCLAVVNGRSFEERREADPVAEAEDEVLKKHGSEMRHQRKRRWQMNYRYDYPGTIPTYNYPDRREYDSDRQDLLPKIVKLLEEIAVYVRRPPAPQLPPQPIYIPYPVPYAIPQYMPCVPQQMPNITSRFPAMEDTNQNWGFVMNEDTNRRPADGARPISFDPIKPIRPLKRPAPKVEHGSEQADSSQVTQVPKFEDEIAVGRAPIACSAAILACCADNQRQECFNSFGCGDSYANGKACETASVNEALEVLRSSYSPMP